MMEDQTDNIADNIAKDDDNEGILDRLSDDSVLYTSYASDHIEDTIDLPELPPIQDSVTFTPSDPFFSQQWHLSTTLSNADIDILDVWDDYTGVNAPRIAIMDDGFDFNHPDFNLTIETSIDYDALGNDNDATGGVGDNHGTAVMGTIKADHNNIGGAGVAPDVEIMALRRGFGHQTNLDDTVDNLNLALNDAATRVLNNSWGATTSFGDNFNIDYLGTDYKTFGDNLEAHLNSAGDSLDTIVVFAAGNDRTEGDNVNYHNYQNSPYTITVASHDQYADISSFSTPGAAILLSAPGSAIQTTDVSGSGGYIGSSDYVTINGTSFAAPIASGVIALMLEANPDLGYRDVQEILALSSKKPTAAGNPSDDGWQVNGATNWNGGGMYFSHDYGFGMLDAHAAVRLAESWGTAKFGDAQRSYENLSRVTDSLNVSAAIPENGTLSTSININQDIEIEHVLITLDINHAKAGDIEVRLISPDGTISTLIDNPDNGNFQSNGGIDFELSTLAHFGEGSAGTWTLEVSDNVSNGLSGLLVDWSIEFLGEQHSDNDLYVYTEDFGFAHANGTNYFGETRNILDDSGGIDTLNLTAIKTDTYVNLFPDGMIDFFDMVDVNFAQNTVIERVLTGDGDDHIITSNATDNYVDAGRGDDTIGAFGQNDQIHGGAGNDTVEYLSYSVSEFNYVIDGSYAFQAQHLAEGWTNVLTGIENIVFSDASFNWADFITFLDTFVPGLPNLTWTMDVAGSIDSFDINSSNVSDFYSYNDLGLGSYNGPAVTYERSSGSTFNFVRNHVGADVRQINLNYESNGNFTVDFFQDVNIITNGTGDSVIDIDRAQSASVVTGSGNDTVTIDYQMFDSSIAYSQNLFDVRTHGGDDTVTITTDNRFTVRAYGGDGNDTLTAIGFSDVRLYGEAGNDILNGQIKDDLLYGGLGDDTLNGNAGNDILRGNEGNDTLNGGAGEDRLYGSIGNDIINGGNNNDNLYGEDGNDTIDGGHGQDRIFGHAGEDILRGGDDRDYIYGGSDDDTIFGDAGSDYLYGEDGNDTIEGGAGIDRIYGHGGNDIIRGGDDTDYIYGMDDDDQLFGEGGVDRILGGIGNDIIEGGAGHDRLYGEAGHDTIRGGADNDRIYGHDGNDTLYGDDGVDALYGMADNDRLYSGSGDDFLYGGDGNDVLIAFDGSNRLYGEGGNDTFVLQGLDASIDSILDFSYAQDTLNLASFVQNYTAGVDDINDFIRFEDASTTSIYIDSDGAGGSNGFERIAYLSGDLLGGFSAQDLITSGHLDVTNIIL